LCCGNGKVQLPLLKDAPTILKQLLFDSNSREGQNFQQHIRTYNMMFVFTSPGAKVDKNYNNGHGPPNLRIQDQACHIIGSLLPPKGQCLIFPNYIFMILKMKHTIESNH